MFLLHMYVYINIVQIAQAALSQVTNWAKKEISIFRPLVNDRLVLNAHITHQRPKKFIQIARH